MTAFGPNGEAVYRRTYARTKPDGTKETYPETVDRVVRGNLALVHGDSDTWEGDVWHEYNDLVDHMLDFRIIPAGRHLWASGVKGRQYLMNCWTSGWTENLSDHFSFTFSRLMEGGGVGASYNSLHLTKYGMPRRDLEVHIVCDPDHPDFQDMVDAGLISTEYNSEWDGAYEVGDSREGWAAALTDLIDTFMTDEEVRHYRRVYDVTNVRHKGARLKTFGGTASGPQPWAQMMHDVANVLNEAYEQTGKITVLRNAAGMIVRTIPARYHLTPIEAMQIDHHIAECVVSGGVRRSARMATLVWDDPYIQDFLSCKADSGLHWTTNISVEIDHDFIEDVMIEDNSRGAVDVHEAVVTGMLTNGEPGYWNSELSNVGEVEPVFCTNPCGEITLAPFEACNLGHVNLDAFAPKTGGETWNWGAISYAHWLMARFLVRATFADIEDEKSRYIEDRNRRIGVGHLGVQGFLAKSGVKYSAAPGYEPFRELLSHCQKTVREAARQYAFALRIPEPIKVTTVAPTGSIAKMPGVTEGIHPILFRFFEQRIRYSSVDPDQAAQIEEAKAAGFATEIDMNDRSGNTMIVVYPTKHSLVEQVEAMGYPASLVEQADELTVAQSLAFQKMYQTLYADNAVSFTVNVPAEDHQNEALKLDPYATPPAPTSGRLDQVSRDLIKHLPYLKGTTLMLDGSRPQAPYTAITEAEYLASQVATVADDIDENCATGACPIR